MTVAGLPADAPASADPAPLDGVRLLPVVRSLVVDELSAQAGRPIPPAVWAVWGLAASVDEDGVGADSLARLDLVGRVNAFFHLHEVGTEDYLVVRRTLGEWAEIVAETLKLKRERLSVRTSGSTGTPKTVIHAWADLDAEIEALTGLLPGVRRVVGFVAPHHLFGFLFTVLLPARLGVEAVDARIAPASLGPGDLGVATPHQWRAHLAGGARLDGSTLVSSGAPSAPEDWAAWRAAGAARILEVYGATETAGIGWRASEAEPFTLFAGWRRLDDDHIARGDGEPVLLPDRCAWDGERRLGPIGRRDGAVQVGGVNVFPARIAAVLAEAPGVAAAQVRLIEAGPGAGRLKAFIVPAAGDAATDALEAAVRAAASSLTPPERPVRYSFGPALPVSEMGKAVDWE